MKAVHIQLTEKDVTEYALLPGDPGRASLIANFLEDAVKLAENREYISYRGVYKGIPVTVCSTGIGGPSTAIAIEELPMLGVKNFIRVGTCGSLVKEIDIGSITVPYAAVRMNGTSTRYVEEVYPAVADPSLYQAILKAAERLKHKVYTGIVLTHDRFYAPIDELLNWAEKNVIAVEMEASVFFTLASLKGLKAAAILAVDGNLANGTRKDKLLHDRVYLETMKKAIEKEILIALEAIIEHVSKS